MKKIQLIVLLLASLTGYSQTLPDFAFAMDDQSTLTKGNIAKGKPVIVFYFDPFCEQCATQAELLKSQLSKFATATLIWVTNEPDWSALNAFADKWFAGTKNVVVCNDNLFKFDIWFGYSEVPTIYTYNSKWERTGKFTEGTLPIELLEAIR